MRSLCGRVIGSTGQQHRRVLGALWNEDYGVELHAVAHGDHHLTADVIETAGRRFNVSGDFAGQRFSGSPLLGLSWGGNGNGHDEYPEEESSAQTTDEVHDVLRWKEGIIKRERCLQKQGWRRPWPTM